MIATRLSAVWQVAGVAGAALCCYLVSQSVASERAALSKVERRIADTEDDIRRLNTEIGARGRMVQLQRWNREVLALQAPRPRQFVADGVQLASLFGRRGAAALPLDPAITGQVAATQVAYSPAVPAAAPPASAPMAPAIEQPLLRTATYIRPTASPLAIEAAPVQRVTYTRVPPLSPPSVRAQLVEAQPSSSTAKAKKGRPFDKLKAKGEQVARLETPAAKPERGEPDVSRAAAKPKGKATLLPADIGALAAAESRAKR